MSNDVNWEFPLDAMQYSSYVINAMTAKYENVVLHLFVYECVEIVLTAHTHAAVHLLNTHFMLPKK